jgi:threonine dehydrogenase-like Zn-dependent dehydrogenase
LQLALPFGAEHIVDANDEAAADEVADWTDGDGADVVVEATGSPFVLRQCIDAAAFGARVLVLGTPSEEAPFPVLEITRKELDIRGSRNNANCFPEALRIVGAMPEKMERLITQRFDLSKAAEAFSFAAEHPEQTEKIMIMVS